MTNRTNSGAARRVCTETLYNVQWLAQLALLVVVRVVVVRVAVNPHPKRLWVHNYWVNSMSIIT